MSDHPNSPITSALYNNVVLVAKSIQTLIRVYRISSIKLPDISLEPSGVRKLN